MNLDRPALERVYTMPELAALVGWKRARLVRRLRSLDEQCGGTLLKNMGKPGKRPWWTTTLSALRAIAPQWCRDDEAIENRLESIETTCELTSVKLDAAGTQIVVLTKRVRELTAKTSLFEETLAAVMKTPQARAQLTAG